MKERPILFSGEMVRAILDGRKTQTRRVIKPDPWGYEPSLNNDGLWEFCDDCELDEKHHIFRCPYGVPGDQLWVRENFWVDDDGQPVVFYAATDCRSDIPLTPSIFMPRAYSRITLEITKIRVEQVQEISWRDCLAEGIEEDSDYKAHIEEIGRMNSFYPKIIYKQIWDSINAKRGYSWASNPWVWVIEFRRIA